jgi:hypothetical protein
MEERASDTPKVKSPSMRKLTGRNSRVGWKSAFTTSMIRASGIMESSRFTSPEMVVAKGKIDLGARTCFIRRPFHPRLVIEPIVDWAKKFQGR